MSRRHDPEDEAFAERLAACSYADFDGHTEFDRLSLERQIEEREHAAWFLYECKGKGNGETTA
jgi:hypothetical protein